MTPRLLLGTSESDKVLEEVALSGQEESASENCILIEWSKQLQNVAW